jgi:hypothetical protein
MKCHCFHTIYFKEMPRKRTNASDGAYLFLTLESLLLNYALNEETHV